MKTHTERLVENFGHEAVGGFEPGPGLSSVHSSLPVVSPDTLEGVGEVMRFASREHLRVLPAGAGEHLARGAPFPNADLVLSTRRLRRIVEYEREDMTLVVQAGVPLHEIDAQTRKHGQRLGPDPAPGRVATIGGAVAAHRFGPNRASAGSMRDVLLGARVVHADGRMSKTGGQVVKNVTGYDLGKLYVGSCGSLALLVELSLRLGSRPEATALLVAITPREDAQDLLLRLHRDALQPAALLVVAGRVSPQLPIPAGSVAVVVWLEGREATVRWQTEQTAVLGPFEKKSPDEARTLYETFRDFEEPVSDTVHLRVSSLPVDVLRVLETLGSCSGWDQTTGSGFLGLFGVGTTRVRMQAPVQGLEPLDKRLEEIGARLVIESAPNGSPTHPGRVPDPVAWKLVRATKIGFDPEGRLRP